MPKAKKSMKLRDQKPMKDPHGGGHGGAKNKNLNSVGLEGNKEQKHGHGRGHGHF
jgi:hypothetical protein